MTRSVFFLFCLGIVSLASLPAGARESEATHDLARQLSRAFGDVYEKVSPGVVVIEAEQVPADARAARDPWGSMFLFQDPYGRRLPRGYGQMNQGSGFIITPDGFILTNNHVLQGAAANRIKVTLRDGRSFPGTVVGVDRISDLAVLKIDASDLPVVEFGDSDKARVGEFAFALGAPYDLRDSFTYGIISAKGRTDLTGSPYYEEFIQTDASINPGNSGGPLVDIDGKVIGVNTLVHGLDSGLGFAIPINMARDIASQLIAKGRVSRPWLGINIIGVSESRYQNVPGLPQGVIVEGIQPGTPAGLSGLRVNDIITAVDGAPVKSSRELQKTILGKEIGGEVVLDVWRNGRTVKVKVRTAENTEGLILAAHRAPQRDVYEDVSTPLAGMQLEELTADQAIARKTRAEHGVVVKHVEKGSPADVAGVKVGDVITAAGKQPVHTPNDVADQLARAAQGQGVLLDIEREGNKDFAIIKP